MKYKGLSISRHYPDMGIDLGKVNCQNCRSHIKTRRKNLTQVHVYL